MERRSERKIEPRDDLDRVRRSARQRDRCTRRVRRPIRIRGQPGEHCRRADLHVDSRRRQQRRPKRVTPSGGHRDRAPPTNQRVHHRQPRERCVARPELVRHQPVVLFAQQRVDPGIDRVVVVHVLEILAGQPRRHNRSRVIVEINAECSRHRVHLERRRAEPVRPVDKRNPDRTHTVRRGTPTTARIEKERTEPTRRRRRRVPVIGDNRPVVVPTIGQRPRRNRPRRRRHPTRVDELAADIVHDRPVRRPGRQRRPRSPHPEPVPGRVTVRIGHCRRRKRRSRRHETGAVRRRRRRLSRLQRTVLICERQRRRNPRTGLVRRELVRRPGSRSGQAEQPGGIGDPHTELRRQPPRARRVGDPPLDRLKRSERLKARRARHVLHDSRLEERRGMRIARRERVPRHRRLVPHTTIRSDPRIARRARRRRAGVLVQRQRCRPNHTVRAERASRKIEPNQALLLHDPTEAERTRVDIRIRPARTGRHRRRHIRIARNRPNRGDRRINSHREHNVGAIQPCRINTDTQHHGVARLGHQLDAHRSRRVLRTTSIERSTATEPVRLATVLRDKHHAIGPVLNRRRTVRNLDPLHPRSVPCGSPRTEAHRQLSARRHRAHNQLVTAGSAERHTVATGHPRTTLNPRHRIRRARCRRNHIRDIEHDPINVKRDTVARRQTNRPVRRRRNEAATRPRHQRHVVVNPHTPTVLEPHRPRRDFSGSRPIRVLELPVRTSHRTLINHRPTGDESVRHRPFLAGLRPVTLGAHRLRSHLVRPDHRRARRRANHIERMIHTRTMRTISGLQRRHIGR
mgnify:CR=1 FL=1